MNDMLWVALILILAIGLVGAFRWFNGSDDKLVNAAQGSLSLISLIAILFTGYWFLFERKAYPQADVEQKVEVRRIGPDLVLISAIVAVKNDGHTVLNIRQLNSRLLQIEPLTLPLHRHREWGRDSWPDALPKRAGDPVTLDKRRERVPIYHHGQLRFEPVRGIFLNADAASEQGNALMLIEPGETDRRIVDFVTDCRLATARVVTEVNKPTTDGSGRPFQPCRYARFVKRIQKARRRGTSNDQAVARDHAGCRSVAAPRRLPG